MRHGNSKQYQEDKVFSETVVRDHKNYKLLEKWEIIKEKKMRNEIIKLVLIMFIAKTEENT